MTIEVLNPSRGEKMSPMKSTALTLVLLGATAAAWANPPARVGLWEVAGRVGVGPRPGGVPQKVCITEESKKRGSESVQTSNGCTSKTIWTGNRGVFDMTCANGRTGHGEFVYANAQQYQGFIEFNDGKKPPTVRRTDITGHWLSADCGDTKPMMPPEGAKKP
jgi:Protein of unknown function (DUF3617)